MEKEIEADSLFQLLIKLFYAAFGIEHPSQIKTELKEILAKSVRIDAIVSFPDDFDFTKLMKRIFPWLGPYGNIQTFAGIFASSCVLISLRRSRQRKYMREVSCVKRVTILPLPKIS